MHSLKSRSLTRSLSCGARYWSSASNERNVRPIIVLKRSSTEGESLWSPDGLLLVSIILTSIAAAFQVFGPVPTKPEYGEAWKRQRQAQRNLGGDKIKDLGEREGPIFIPVWWPRKQKARPYDAESAEIKTFEELHQDPSRRDKIQTRLANLAIGSTLNNQNREISQGLGYGSVRSAVKGWFEYPTHPPQEYEQRGFNLTGSGITWTKKVVTSDNYSRMERLVIPKAMANALLAAHKSYWNDQVSSLTRALGLKVGKDTSPSAPRTVRLTPEQRQQIKDPIALYAVIAFHRALARSRKPPAIRGTCVVKVLIEMIGPQGRCAMMVYGDYLPSKDTIVTAKITILALHPLNPGSAVQAKSVEGSGTSSGPEKKPLKLDSQPSKPERKPSEPDGKPLKLDGQRAKAEDEHSKPD